MKNQKEIKESIPFTTTTKKIKYLGINLPKETKELYIENYKTLMKELKDDTNGWREIPCSWVRRINIVKIIVTKCNLQIQCDSYQITNGIFHRTRAKIFTIPVEALACLLSHFSHVQLSANPWTMACQASLSIGFSRQEYWSGLPFTPSVIKYAVSEVKLLSHV